MRNRFLAIVIERFQIDYKKAKRPEKTLILNQIQKITDVERKYLIKLLAGRRPSSGRTAIGRPKVYSKDLQSIFYACTSSWSASLPNG